MKDIRRTPNRKKGSMDRGLSINNHKHMYVRFSSGHAKMINNWTALYALDVKYYNSLMRIHVIG